MIKISRVLHAGYIFESEGTRIIFDPLFENPFSRNCYAYPSVHFDFEALSQEKFTAIFISHYHDDHCSLESLNHLDRDIPIYMYCGIPEFFSLLRKLGFKNVYSMELNVPISLGSFEIIPRRALDADVDSLYQIKAAGVQILNVVDSWIDYETLGSLVQQKPWDLILWPFQTMLEMDVIAPELASPADRNLPPEWIDQIQQLAPLNIVPSSCQFIHEPWSWYRQKYFPITYAQFANEMGEVLPSTSVIRLDPGVSIGLQPGGKFAMAPALAWIIPEGPQDVDYDYSPSLVPPSTLEVARHFKALSINEIKTVRDFCAKDLPGRFNQLEPRDESYFSTSRNWQLAVFDHQGKREDYFFIIEGQQMRSAHFKTEEADWVTSIPAARLCGALVDGESLSSLYIRIQVKDADILEDPLLRALYENAGASYQAAQLKKILERRS